MNRVLQNASPEQRLQRPPIHDVTGALQKFVDIQFHPGILEDTHRPILIEIHKHINVAFYSSFAPRHRTEDCRMSNSMARSVSRTCWRSGLIAHHGDAVWYRKIEIKRGN